MEDESKLYRSIYGDSEELMGKWFKRTGKRDDIVVVTKFGFVKGHDHTKGPKYDTSAAYTREACLESLRVLGIDSIDLCKAICTLVCVVKMLTSICLFQTMCTMPVP